MRRSGVVLALLALSLIGACGDKGEPGAGPTATLSNRPAVASTGKLTIVSPKPGETIKGSTVKLRLTLSGAEIVPATTRDVKPDEGHLHVLLDGRLITMTAGLETDMPQVAPGAHILRVEFVAGDHAPFTPRVVQETGFTVTP